MAKFNVVQKRRRAEKAQRKRAIHGDPVSAKLKNKPQPLSLSGKRKRKLFKRWRREQKEALEKGIVSMEDVEMAVSQGTSEETNKNSTKFHLKKSVKLKHLKRKGSRGKNKIKPSKQAAAEVPVEDAMVE